MKPFVVRTIGAAVIALVAPVAARAQSLPANHAVSREVSIFNGPADGPVIDSAVSREFGVFNSPLIDIRSDHAVSREYSIVNGPPDIPADLAVSRELSVRVPPYTFPEAVTALRIVSGLSKAGSPEMVRLNVVVTGTSSGVIDVLDAWQVAVFAARNDPDL